MFGSRIGNARLGQKFGLDGLLKLMQTSIAKLSHKGAGLKVAEQMSLRAQQAAVSATIVTPPPFPRVIWCEPKERKVPSVAHNKNRVLIVDRCDTISRCVVLPLTCRFFRNLVIVIFGEFCFCELMFLKLPESTRLHSVLDLYSLKSVQCENVALIHFVYSTKGFQVDGMDNLSRKLFLLENHKSIVELVGVVVVVVVLCFYGVH